jgi:CelD/BcsL family acetyltransferase involved in cellulose biosynthesis
MNKIDVSAAAMGDVSISVFDSMSDAEAAWRAFESTSDNYIFQTYDWLRLWHDCIGAHEDVRPHIVLVSGRDDRPLLILPLAIQTSSGVKRLVWLGGKETDYQGPLLAGDFWSRIAPEGFKDLWARVLAALPAFDVIFFEKQPATIGEQKNPFLTLGCIPYVEDAHFTRLVGSWDEYFRSKRSSKKRGKYRNQENGLRKLGELSFGIVSEPSQVHAALEELFEWKSQQYDQTGVQNNLRWVGRKEFYEGMVLDPELGKTIKLFVLKIDDEVISGDICAPYKRRNTGIFHFGYNRKLSKYSVGELLRMRITEWCFENGMDIYDYSIGDDIYKNTWCEGTLNLYSYTEAKTIKGWALIALKRTRNRLSGITWLKSAVRSARSLVVKRLQRGR